MLNPCESCPAVRTCELAEAYINIYQEGVDEQTAHLQAAEESLNEGELNFALAVLNGEVTAEESDNLRRGIWHASFEEGLDRILEIDKAVARDRQAEIDEAKPFVDHLAGALATSAATCSGPRISVWGQVLEQRAKLRLMKDQFFGKLSGSGESIFIKLSRNNLESVHQKNLHSRARCSSQSVSQARRNLGQSAFFKDKKLVV